MYKSKEKNKNNPNSKYDRSAMMCHKQNIKECGGKKKKKTNERKGEITKYDLQKLLNYNKSP